MLTLSRIAICGGSRKPLLRAAAAILFSVALGAAGPAFAEPHGGGSHGGGSHGGGFHRGGFRGGGFHAGGFHGGRFHGGFHHGYAHRGYGIYPGLGLGFALGAAYPWGWGYFPPAYGYYGYAQPYARQVWYYCSNPPGYYPYVGQCYAPWQAVPAG